MFSFTRTRLAVFGGLAALAVVGLGVAPALASTVTATAHIVPRNAKVSFAVPPQGYLEITFRWDGSTETAYCYGFSTHGRTPADGLTFPLSPPKASDCSQSPGPGQVQVTTYDNNGPWTYTLNATGTDFTLGIPKAGATFIVLGEGCTITFAKTGPATISGPVLGAVTTGTVPITTSSCGKVTTSTWSFDWFASRTLSVKG
jgi:hypothetical protein